MFYYVLLSLFFQGRRTINISTVPTNLASQDDTYYFFFQNEDEDFKENSLQFSFSYGEEPVKTITPQQNKGYAFTNCNLSITTTQTNYSLTYWQFPSKECTDDSYIISTTQQMHVSTKTSKFCFLTSYLFTSASVSFTASDLDEINNNYYYSTSSYFTKVPSDGSKINANHQIFLKGSFLTSYPVSIDIIFSTMNNKKVYKHQCDVIPFETFGEKKTSLGIKPSFQCTDLNGAAFSPAIFSLLALIIFSLLLFILHKCGVIDVVKFFKVPETNEFQAPIQHSDEENIITAFQDEDIHEGQL